MSPNNQNPRSPEGPIVRIGVLARSVRLDGSDTSLFRDRIREVLKGIKSSLDNVDTTVADEDEWEPLRFAILTSLAEGADRLVAVEGLKLGYELHCALPYAQETVEEHATDDSSREEFRVLLDRATEVTDLEGDAGAPEERDAAHAELDRWLVETGDVLLTVWDETGAEELPELVRAALARDMAAVWIAPRPPFEASHLLLAGPDGTDWRTENLEAFLNQVGRYGL